MNSILILVHTDYPWPEGLSYRVHNMAKLLSSTQNDVIVVAPILESYHPVGFQRIDSYRVCRTRIPLIEKLKSNRTLYRLVFALAFALRMPKVQKSIGSGQKVSFVQAEQQYSILPAFVLSLLFSVPLILDDALDSEILLGDGQRLGQFLMHAFETVFFRFCRFVITGSTHVANILEYRYSLNSPKLRVIQNGVDVPPEAPVQNRRNAEEKNIVFMGSMYSKQNIRAICNSIRIFDVIRNRVKGAKLLIIGGPLDLLHEDDTFQKLGNLVRSRDILLLGRVSEQEKARILQTAAVCILPYDLNDKLMGGIRLKALEFLSYGKIVASTTTGIEGIEGAIHEGNLIVSNDFDDIANNIIDVLHNPGKYQKIRENAIQLASRYEWKNILTEYLRLVETFG